MPQQHPFAAVVALPRDDQADRVGEPTAHGALHWAPHHDDGYHARMQMLAQWVADAQPQVCVVDVSVEVALFLRLLGVPTVVFALPGDRTDAPHEAVHRAADHILAAWPAGLNTPRWLQPHTHKTSYVGGISRFEGRRPEHPGDDRELRILVLGGAADVSGCRTGPDLPDVSWTAIGGASGRWVDDPWPYLCVADVVVSHAGQNSIADIAAAQRPAIVVPQPRPFGEQDCTAAVLDRHALATVTRGPVRDEDWPGLVHRAARRDPAHWRRWQVHGAAARAAAAVEDTAVRCRSGAGRR
ncbi:glycosyltransferase [Mycobacterium sp. pV006]|uniref:glycosyltransferase n=1 Tax=Mycobacterium sp. pV006 TaxID=3238983 RepID=UPI00351B7854